MGTTAELIAKIKRDVEKRYKDSTEIFPDFLTIKAIDVIPHKSAIINAVTGVGGLPRGRVTEIFGPEGSGKTTLAIENVVSLQNLTSDGVAAYLDFEHAFDASYARALGCNLTPDKFIFIQPEYFEQGVEAVSAFLDAGVLDLLVVDSAAAMTPKAILNGSMEDSVRIGLQAQLMSRWLEVLTKKVNKGKKPAVVVINQTRVKIDINNPRNNGEDAAGGKALKFYTSLRLKLEEVKNEGDSNRGDKGMDQVFTRKRIRITAVKNKIAPPFFRGKFVIDFGKGINNEESIAELAEDKLGIMTGAGYFAYKGDTPETSFTCRGRDNFRDLLLGNSALLKEIEAKVLAAIRQDQAKILGIDQISVSGAAKVIEKDDLDVMSTSVSGGMNVEELD